MAPLQVLKVSQSGLVEAQLETQPQLAESVVLGSIQLLGDEFSQSSRFLLDG